MAFFIAAAFACLSVVAAYPGHHHGFGQKGGFSFAQGTDGSGQNALPYQPTVIQSQVPVPVTFGSSAPGVIEHFSAPYEINYFEKPWVVKHKQSAALNVLTQTPVVLDEYAAPVFNEVAAPPAVIVEEVGAPAGAGGFGAGAGFGNGFAGSYGSGNALVGSGSYGSVGGGSCDAPLIVETYPCH